MTCGICNGDGLICSECEFVEDECECPNGPVTIVACWNCGGSGDEDDDDDDRACVNCGDICATLSSRDWCDACEGEAADEAEFGADDDA